MGRSECETEAWPAQPSASLFKVTVHAGPFPILSPVAAWPDPEAWSVFSGLARVHTQMHTCMYMHTHTHTLPAIPTWEGGCTHAHMHSWLFSHGKGAGLLPLGRGGYRQDRVAGGRPQAGFQPVCPPSLWSRGEGHGNPLRYSCLENPTDRGAGWSRRRLKRLSTHAHLQSQKRKAAGLDETSPPGL